MKIKRNLDGKVYQVHDSTVAHGGNGQPMVLITNPDDKGQQWILRRYTMTVPDDTPVDVP